MKSCPCECGRQLGWSDARVAKSAAEVLARLPYLYRIALHTDREAPATAATAHQFVDAGVDYARGVLHVAHGDHSQAAQRSMPPISAGAQWIRQADRLRGDIAKIDPRWWSWYRGVGAPKADVEVLGTWTGQLRGGAHLSGPELATDPTPKSKPATTNNRIHLATVNPRVAGLIGSREVNWMMARDQMDRLAELPEQRPSTLVTLETELRRVADLAGENDASRVWMLERRNIARILTLLYMGYGVGRLALGTIDVVAQAAPANPQEAGADASDLADRLDFRDVVAASPAPTALAATVDGISAEEAKTRLADPVERLEVLALRAGFLAAVAEEIVLGDKGASI